VTFAKYWTKHQYRGSIAPKHFLAKSRVFRDWNARLAVK
jgi:hypothetical protein